MAIQWTSDRIREYIINQNDNHILVDIISEKGIYSEIIIKCPNKNHEPYKTIFMNYLYGHRCKACVKHDLDYCKNVFEKEGYTILQDFYTKARDKIKCRCPDGHEIEISLDNFQRGKRCRGCSRKHLRNTNYNINNKHFSKYSEVSIKEINEKGYYLIDKVDTEKISCLKKYNFMDKDGYKYYTKAKTVLNNTAMKFYIHNPYTDYNLKIWLKLNFMDSEYEFLSEFKGRHEKISIKYIGEDWRFEEKDRIFSTIFGDFLYRKKHPLKRISNGEINIKLFLDKNNIKYEKEKSFKDLIFKGYLRFDFYIEEIKTAIEFHGLQHEKPVDIFGGEKTFKSQLEKDNLKREYCKNNNIKLIEIWYKDFKNIDSILTKELNLEIQNE